MLINDYGCKSSGNFRLLVYKKNPIIYKTPQTYIFLFNL